MHFSLFPLVMSASVLFPKNYFVLFSLFFAAQKLFVIGPIESARDGRVASAAADAALVRPTVLDSNFNFNTFTSMHILYFVTNYTLDINTIPVSLIKNHVN